MTHPDPGDRALALANLDRLVLWDSVVDDLRGRAAIGEDEGDPFQPGPTQRWSAQREADLASEVFAQYGVLLGQLQQIESAVLLMLQSATEQGDVEGDRARALGRLPRTERCQILADVVWEAGRAESLGAVLGLIFDASQAHTLLAEGILDSTTNGEGQLDYVVLHHPALEHGLESLDAVITIDEAIKATIATGVVASELGLLGFWLDDGN